MRIAITFLLFLVFSSLLQASPIPFSPIVRNYSVSDYNAGIQNWAIAQDERGVMYFGNNSGLLEFDGSAWRLYELPTKGIVRAIYISEDGRIYVGSYEEFGYFVRTPYDTLEYHSLKNKVKDFAFHNDEIWDIACVQGEIVFQSFGSLFFYNGNSVEGIRMKNLPLNLFQVGNTFYSQRINGGLYVFAGREMKELIPRKAFGDSDVLAGLPYDDAVLMFTRNQGGFLYRDGRVEKWETECDDIFRKHTINRAVMTKDSCYVVGTISDGIYALDKKGKLIWKVNTDNKLQNNTVLRLYCDDDNNIWTALDEGIAYIHNNSLIYYYEPPFRKIGMVYDVLVRENEAYIASNQGLYWLRDGKTELVPGLEEQAWFVDEWGKQIFCGHNKGTFLISGLKSKLASDVKGGMCMEKIELKEQSFLLEGAYALLNLYTETASGEYCFTRSLRGFSHMIRHIEVDHQGNIWAKHLRNGLYRFRIDSDMKQVKDVRKYESLGEVKGGSFTLFKINGRVVFSNGEYFYTYEDMTDSIVPYETMNEQLMELKGIKTVSHANGDYYWFVGDRTVYLVKCAINTFNIELRIPYSLFDGLAVEERGSVVYDKRNNHSYLCLNNAIARIETEMFVHGAICVAYSGQCLMSSMIGGRSGNRGRCAQPCRMEYTLKGEHSGETKGHLLSPKDMCTIEDVEDIVDTGVYSLKIEGRMKRAEYVAGVVDNYKKAVDKVLYNNKYDDQAGKRQLLQLFNRSGFTNAYLKKNTGKDMMSFNSPKNSGISLGVVDKNGDIVIKEDLNVGDGIRYRDKGFTLSKILYKGNEVKSAKRGDKVKLYPIDYKKGDDLHDCQYVCRCG